MTDLVESNVDAPLGDLQEILKHPEKRIVPVLYASKKDDKETRKNTRAELVKISQFLFQEIEGLAQKYHQLTNSDKEGDTTSPALSGLPEMYVPEDDVIDAETLWGQVELQNNALHKVLKKSIKRLAKSPKDIVLLDMGPMSSDEEGDDDDDEDQDNKQEEVSGDENDNSEEEEEEEDQEAMRIRERMERAMDDMESGEDDEDADMEQVKKVEALPDKSKEEIFDPVAEDMKDGFFDLNEMEDFADEEEDYLPEDVYGKQPEKKKKQKKQNKSFHQMQRDGDLLNGSDDDDEDDLEDMYENAEPVQRKKYREDEDVGALYNLYQPPKQERGDEEGVNMMAADLFGQPKKKYIEQYKKNATKSAKTEVKGDDDSWGEYDFEKEDQSGWRGKTHKDDDDDAMDEEGTDDEGEEEEGDEEEPVDEKKKTSKKEDNSKHAKQAEKLRKQTEEYEKEMLAEKPWHMTGETKSTSRPVNSLLQGTPEFEMASKRAPTITIEHTANIEEIIKKRILAEDWDDVVPRELPDVAWNKKRGEAPEVSQEKSKLGLGELYEREYLKKAVGYDRDADEKQTEEGKAKDEMKQLFANLCSKLDGLSNYHFAPRPISNEVEVRTVTAPAIAMEEVLPLHVSDARGVAPEEVYGTKRGREGILRGETEMDQTERKRLRQSKKSARRKVRKEKLADEKLISRLEPGLGLNNPYEKRKIREELSVARARGRVTTGEQDQEAIKFGSSGTFFKRLQNEAQKSIRDKTGGGDEPEEKVAKPKSSAFKL
jgi:U3 small nucleolar RNA-associated protein MPP10